LVSLSFSTLCFPLFCPCGYLLKPPSAWRAGLLMFCHQSLMFSSSSIFKGKVMINGWPLGHANSKLGYRKPQKCLFANIINILNWWSPEPILSFFLGWI
jgi:hypothetical protein